MAAYTITEEKRYSQPAGTVFEAALGAVGGLEGKVLKQDAAGGKIEAQFDKKIHGKVLGDRTQLTVQINDQAADQTIVVIEMFPVDAVGRPLMFGARKGVARTVTDWYWAHLEHRLGK